MDYFLITVDVEDRFQVENFRPHIPFSTWNSRELRVEQNVHRLLDLFDELSANRTRLSVHASEGTASSRNRDAYPFNIHEPSVTYCERSRIQATFFVLGWVAERLPHLVREIAARGHEVASHGYNHVMCSFLPSMELVNELKSSKDLLENITGEEIHGFRAPNFSVTDEVLKTVAACGYRYDSSYNSFAFHGRYGNVSLVSSLKSGIAHQLDAEFYELPISNLSISCQRPSIMLEASNVEQTGRAGFVLPWGGGAYFRIMPLSIFQRGVQLILERERAYMFYMHPWEIDPFQPRVEQALRMSKLKHYTNLSKVQDRLHKLIEHFAGCRFVGCRGYLAEAALKMQAT